VFSAAIGLGHYRSAIGGLQIQGEEELGRRGRKETKGEEEGGEEGRGRKGGGGGRGE